MIPKRELRAFRVYSLPLLNHMFRATNRRFGHFGRQNLPIHISYIILGSPPLRWLQRLVSRFGAWEFKARLSAEKNAPWTHFNLWGIEEST